MGHFRFVWLAGTILGPFPQRYIERRLAARILPRLQRPEFFQAFVSKGRMQPLLEKVPIRVVNNDQVGVLGAARHASEQLKASAAMTHI